MLPSVSRQIVKRIRDIAGDLQLLSNLECLFVIRARVLVVGFERVRVADIVQNQRLIIFIAGVYFILQRFFEQFQGLIILSSVAIELRQVVERVGGASPIADLAAHI